MICRFCGDFKKKMINLIDYLILLVKWVVISIVIFRWFVYNDLFIIKYMINNKLLV